MGRRSRGIGGCRVVLYVALYVVYEAKERSHFLSICLVDS